ncbi:disulfide bond formation protein B [Aquabacter cavernae]|uniref:disulfide bond formation protein B n=1 Tax=Aquabacter cavernae TaxID=2496029 RepID=UPI000F8E374D|nr:disulfide bond formation protein B [Aquabacter cavernae]
MQLRSPTVVCALLALGSAATLAAAWYFQLVIGLTPCPLCLDQRIPYYVAVPLTLILAVLSARGRPGLARAGLWVIALLMAGNALLGVYHAGIEWHFWQGPTTCSGSAPAAISDIMSALKTAHVPRCDEAAWRLFGISMAGWNVLVAAALSALAVFGARSGGRPAV